MRFLLLARSLEAVVGAKCSNKERNSPLELYSYYYWRLLKSNMLKHELF